MKHPEDFDIRFNMETKRSRTDDDPDYEENKKNRNRASDWNEDKVKDANVVPISRPLEVDFELNRFNPTKNRITNMIIEHFKIIYMFSGTSEQVDEGWAELEKRYESIDNVDSGLLLLFKSFILTSNNIDEAESNVDTFIYILLGYINMASYKDKTQIKQNLETNVAMLGISMKVKPDVSIIINLDQKPNIQLVCCENKKANSKKNAKEHYAQAVAEVLAAYQTNMDYYKNKDKEMYNLMIKYKMPFFTVKGHIFQFYRVENMTEKYMTSLINGKVDKSIELNIIQLTEKLSFERIEDLSVILRTLLYLKDYIHKHSVEILKLRGSKDKINVKEVSPSLFSLKEPEEITFEDKSDSNIKNTFSPPTKNKVYISKKQTKTKK